MIVQLGSISAEQAQAFWSHVSLGNADECWPWSAAKQPFGYGVMRLEGRNVRATHVALTLDGRPRPGALIALHSCDNPVCVNPAHLRWGTDADNAADRDAKGRHWCSQKTHCKNGHAFTPDNLVPLPGRRKCKTCHKLLVRKYKDKVRDAGRAARALLRATTKIERKDAK